MPSTSSLLYASGIVLPALSRADRTALQAGERIQKQERSGRSGYGIVVLDVQAPPDAVFETLTMFDKYMDIIPTVRSVKIFSSNEINTLVSRTGPLCGASVVKPLIAHLFGHLLTPLAS